MMKIDGISFDASKEAIAEIAREASSLGDGARGLRTILENNLLDAMYNLPSSSIKKFQLDAKDKKLLLKYDQTNQVSANITN